jgi:hypothetical protein
MVMADRKTTTSGDDVADEALVIEPTQAEIDEWAARETERRQTWLNGPSEAERMEYAQRVRQRRLAEAFDESEAKLAESVRLGMHYGRETQLAAEGAMALFYRFSRRTLTELVRAGREWEQETAIPNRRRRVRLEDEGS